MSAYEWALTGLVPGREFRVTRVDVRDGAAVVHYVLRPGITEADAHHRLALLPRVSIRPEPPPAGASVQGGFVPDAAETVGDLGLHDPSIRAGEPLTLVLTSVTNPEVALTLQVAPAAD